MSYWQLWLRAFVLTVAIEVPLVTWLTAADGLPSRRRACISLLAQAVTHPVVWCVLLIVPVGARNTTFVLSELWAWLFEAALYAGASLARRKLKAVAISGLANGASLAVGFAVL
jgi:hypothetical protein